MSSEPATIWDCFRHAANAEPGKLAIITSRKALEHIAPIPRPVVPAKTGIHVSTDTKLKDGSPPSRGRQCDAVKAGHALAFGDLADRANLIARALNGAPSGPVALTLQDKTEFLISFMGIMAAGRPALPLDPALPPELREKLLSDLKPAAVLVDGYSGVTPANAGAPRSSTSVLEMDAGSLGCGFCEPSAGPSGNGVGAAAEDGVRGSQEAVRGEVDHNDASGYAKSEFYWGLSSGTTGLPKAFARSHASWLASFAACETVFPFEPGDVAGIPGSLYHSLFLYGAVHALARGLKVAATAKFSPKSAARFFEAAGVTVLYAVPAMLKQWEDAGFGNFAPKRIFCGGAKLEPALRRAIERKLPNADLIEFYGSSELSFVSYASTLKPAPEASAGRAFPGVSLLVRGEDGGTVPNGTQGEVNIKSPMVFSRYLPDGEPVDAAGWHTAGDLGFIDDEGFLHLSGRANRVLNIAGLKISPEAIEALLSGSPGVAAAAVVGVPDESRGVRAVAVIESETQTFDVPTFIDSCRTALGGRYVPSQFYATHRLPRTRTGKIAVKAVQAMVEGGDPSLCEIKR